MNKLKLEKLEYDSSHSKYFHGVYVRPVLYISHPLDVAVVKAFVTLIYYNDYYLSFLSAFLFFLDVSSF